MSDRGTVAAPGEVLELEVERVRPGSAVVNVTGLINTNVTAPLTTVSGLAVLNGGVMTVTAGAALNKVTSFATTTVDGGFALAGYSLSGCFGEATSGKGPADQVEPEPGEPGSGGAQSTGGSGGLPCPRRLPRGDGR